MSIHPTSIHRLPPFSTATPVRRGFTLIEIMIVIAIIVILAGITVAIGINVKINAAKKDTHSILTSLSGFMTEYLKAGNTEPTVSTPYDTNPPSDALNWVRALLASESGPKIRALNAKKDGSGNFYIPDDWGTAIRYVPSNGTKDGYFMSAGPDQIFYSTTSPPTPAPKQDDLFSTDAS